MSDTVTAGAAGAEPITTEPVAVIRRHDLGRWVAIDAVAATGRTFSLYGSAESMADDRIVQTLDTASLALIRAEGDRLAAHRSYAADMEDFDALADAGLS